MSMRDTSGFSQASHQSQALCFATLGSAGLLAPITQWGFASPVRYLASCAAAAAGIWLWSRAADHWRKHKLLLAGVDPDEVDSPATILSQLPGEQARDRQIARLIEVADSRFPGKLALSPDSIEFDDVKGKRELVSWGFSCVEPGFLTDSAVQKRLQSTFAKTLGGVWKFRFDVTEDRFEGSRKSGLPKLAFPPKWPVVKTVEEAKRRYPGWQLKVGVTEDGDLGFRMDKMPHLKVIGETGSGKSVAVRSWLEQHRAAGWMLLLCDGKGPTTAATSPRPRRQRLAGARNRGGRPGFVE